MSAPCSVFLLTGFLGSGKTTVLRHLLETLPGKTEREGPLRCGVLVNEFGKVSIDGPLLRKGRAQVPLWEINRGSIFCYCAKGDFLRTLLTEVRHSAPTLLLVEASGVADPTDLERDFARPILSPLYRLVRNICVVDAPRFEETQDLFPLVSKQVLTAHLLLVNKCDLLSPNERERLGQRLRKLNPAAALRFTSFAAATPGCDLVSWDDLFPAADEAPHATGKRLPFRDEPKNGGENDNALPPLPSEEELEILLDRILQDPEGSLGPSEFFSQTVYWKSDESGDNDAAEPEGSVRSGKDLFEKEHSGSDAPDAEQKTPLPEGPGKLPLRFERLLRSLPADLVRGKGFLRDSAGRLLHYDQTGSTWSVKPYDGPLPPGLGERNCAVFIRRRRDHREIPRLFADVGLEVTDHVL